MKKIVLVVGFIVLIINQIIAQVSVDFPLEIGNKFYYQAGHYPDNGYYAATKTIIDTLENGTRVVLFKKYINNSIVTESEYWQFSDNKLYTSTSPSSFYYPVFDGYFENDTCTSLGSPSVCYALFDSVLFGNNQDCQIFSKGYGNHSGGNFTQIFTGTNVGMFFVYYNAYSFVPPLINEKDSISLVGFINKGVLVGDSVITGIADNYYELISSFELYQNYPNPFNPSTKINFQLPNAGNVILKVYDILGREVATLVDEYKNADSYEVEFNANNLPSGVYLYQLKTGAYIQTKKMILIK